MMYPFKILKCGIHFQFDILQRDSAELNLTFKKFLFVC